MREKTWVDPTETCEVPGSKGVANFVMKWAKDSKHVAWMNVECGGNCKGVIREGITEGDRGEFVPLVGFECRGLEPVDWHPEDGFVVTASGSNAVWEDVDLSEREWYEYDEKSGESVSVTGLEWEFRVHKGGKK